MLVSYVSMRDRYEFVIQGKFNTHPLDGKKLRIVSFAIEH